MAGRRARNAGELEAQLLRLLRVRNSPTSAREITAAFPEPRPAYGTVITTLERLRAKGQVQRVAESPRKVRFFASRTASEDSSEAMVRALALADDRAAVLLRFAGELNAADAAVLRAALEPSED